MTYNANKSFGMEGIIRYDPLAIFIFQYIDFSTIVQLLFSKKQN